ncbi:MAG: hypothetical protein ACE5FQ_04420, partial [Thiogranum sp.]
MVRKKRKSKRRSTGRRRKSRSRRSRFPWGKILFSLLLAVVAYVAFLDFQVYRQFEGSRWTLPARVYARPLELYAGLRLTPEQFDAELRALGYRKVSAARKAGEVSRHGRRFQLISRPFVFWDGQDSSSPTTRRRCPGASLGASMPRSSSPIDGRASAPMRLPCRSRSSRAAAPFGRHCPAACRPCGRRRRAYRSSPRRLR